MKIDYKEFEIEVLALFKFVTEVNKLNFIEDKKLKYDTAKKNFKESFLEHCSCHVCTTKTNNILEIQFYE